MELNEKIQMLLDMQEHPENYSEQALETMLENPDVRELMEATAQLKQAMTWEETGKEPVNTGAEWQRFAKTHLADSAPRRGWLKVAATFIGVLFVTGMTFAAIHIVRMVNSHKAETIQTEQPASYKPSTALPADTVKKDTATTVQPVVFDNVPLENMLTEIAAYYHVEVSFMNDDARQLRFHFVWKREDGLRHAIDKLNRFESLSVRLDENKIIVE